jgi:hypothetical protein
VQAGQVPNSGNPIPVLWNNQSSSVAVEPDSDVDGFFAYQDTVLIKDPQVDVASLGLCGFPRIVTHLVFEGTASAAINHVPLRFMPPITLPTHAARSFAHNPLGGREADGSMLAACDASVFPERVCCMIILRMSNAVSCCSSHVEAC